MKGSNFLLAVIVLFSSLLVSWAQPPLQIEEIEEFPFADRLKKGPSPASTRDFLPETVTPLNYNIFLRPVLDPGELWEQFSVPGTVNVTIICNTATRTITLHGHHTHVIHDVQVVQISNSQSVPVANFSYEQEQQFHHIQTEADLVAGQEYDLFINFTSRVSNTSLQGLYLATYTNKAGEPKRAATTQFEEIGARECFPCWDEPRTKANFTLALARTAGYNTLSSSAHEQTGVQDPIYAGWVIDIYKPTVVMSTYLLAIIVSDFECVRAEDSIFPGRPVQACGPPDFVQRGGADFSATASAQILALLEKTFNNVYPMHKMDSAAIPDPYFAAGAMENWGLNIYREAYLMYYPGESLESNRRQIASVLTHELAHQWFGNLVTCRWWSGIWLNEGFATYVATLFGEVTPEFDSLGEHLWDVQKALAYDIGVRTPIFGSTDSTITYSKGGSIIRMMELWMGKPLVIEALSAYLTEFSFNATVQDDLFEVLNRFAKRDGKIPEELTMKDILETWTLQTGYPLVKVSKLGSQLIVISQEEYLKAPKATKAGRAFDENSLWEIPVAISTAETVDAPAPEVNFWLSQNQAMTTHVLNSSSSWVLFNPDAMVFCRVQYDNTLFGALETQLSVNHSVFSGLSRSQLIDDYFNFALNGHENIENTLRLTKYLAKEKDHIVWTTLFSALTTPLARLGSDTTFQAYLRPRVEGILSEVGMDNVADTGSRVIFRAKVYDWANALQSPVFIQGAAALVEEWRKNETINKVILDNQPVVYCGAVAGSDDIFDFFLAKYNDGTSTAAEKSKYLNALACAQDPATIQGLAESTLDEAQIRKADVTNVLNRIAMSAEGRSVIVRFLRGNFKALQTRLDNSTQFATDVSRTLSSYYLKEADAVDLLQFIEDNKDDILFADALANEITARAQANANWMSDVGNAMLDFFSKNF